MSSFPAIPWSTILFRSGNRCKLCLLNTSFCSTSLVCPISTVMGSTNTVQPLMLDSSRSRVPFTGFIIIHFHSVSKMHPSVFCFLIVLPLFTNFRPASPCYTPNLLPSGASYRLFSTELPGSLSEISETMNPLLLLPLFSSRSVLSSQQEDTEHKFGMRCNATDLLHCTPSL